MRAPRISPGGEDHVAGHDLCPLRQGASDLCDGPGGLGETLQPSKAASNFCNRLVSDIAGASPAAEKTPIILVLLTLSAQVYESGELPVANNRIVFAVRQITQWLDEPNALDPALSAHICRALAQLLPCMKDIMVLTGKAPLSSVWACGRRRVNTI